MNNIIIIIIKFNLCLNKLIFANHFHCNTKPIIEIHDRIIQFKFTMVAGKMFAQNSVNFKACHFTHRRSKINWARY